MSLRPALFSAICLFILTLTSWGQVQEKRDYAAVRISDRLKIDGILDEQIWSNTKSFKGKFFQLEPDNGAESKFETEFTVLYDDKSIYVGLKMYDDSPSEIPTQLSERDNMDNNNDFIGLIFDTYNGGQGAAGFFLSSAGVQGDAMMSSRNEDDDWNAVWNSAIQFTEYGWVAEIEIPYFNLRFPKTENQLWGFNVYRVSKRFNEGSSWNYIDNSIDGWINQSGVLSGIRNIEPPIRLSLMPYISTIYKKDGASGISKKSLAGGMDLKYGINESFTVDLTLIPDFSQVRSDNLILNLSPFEVRYNENRPFFTEGTEMFAKGRLFYSRRVGQSTGEFNEELADNEELSSMPGNTPLINATKVSGRTAKGTGLGIFNAMTNQSYAVVKNTDTGEEREVEVDPFTNFNVLVVDQLLKNNSNIGIINTNIRRAGNGRDANVTFGEASLRDKTNTWRVYTGLGVSMLNEFDEEKGATKDSGHKYSVNFSKVSGNFQFRVSKRAESDNWKINDMGYNQAPNNLETSVDAEYAIFKPFGIFNNFSVSLDLEHTQLFAPRKFTGIEITTEVETQFKNFWYFGIDHTEEPGNSFDYWEPRVDGRVYRQGPSRRTTFSLGSDDRKAFRLRGYVGRWSREEDGAKATWMEINPRFRISDRLSIFGELGSRMMRNTVGYVAMEDSENIIFGIRNITELDAQINFAYTFTPKMNISLRMRNYWSRVEYQDFRLLDIDGNLQPTDYSGIDDDGVSKHNANFDAFNIDLFYNWQIAPGSFFSVGYKTSSSIFDSIIEKNYWTNLDRTMRTPGLTTLSARLIYFLDYSTLLGGR